MQSISMFEIDNNNEEVEEETKEQVIKPIQI
jgi:hypothetical protein